MIELRVRNVHEALAKGIDLFRREGKQRDSRNGPVLQLPEPLCTTYLEPTERVLFHSWRDANPFFHFYESLWMLAGRNDVAPLTRYVKRMAEFSDDGKTFNAAYGKRWRKARALSAEYVSRDGEEHEHFPWDRDQLVEIANNLRKNPNSRQEVLQIWDHEYDLSTSTKDHACNLTATFQTDLEGRLDMTVFCRSNDMIWGGWGANAVHFSMLHEYVAYRAGLFVGKYRQISVNAHVYLATFAPMVEHWSDGEPDPYENEPIYPFPLMSRPALYADTDGRRVPIDNTDAWAQDWDRDCRDFVTADGSAPYRFNQGEDPFWYEVALPIVRAHDLYVELKEAKRRHEVQLDWGPSYTELKRCKADDWRVACEQWLDRRRLK